ncbi:hypothetical protein JX266_000180 [Neoarthrinium moseri]|nr:hypothetical protein JX266_000180 [Neoarthrinium moseri]
MLFAAYVTRITVLKHRATAERSRSRTFGSRARRGARTAARGRDKENDRNSDGTGQQRFSRGTQVLASGDEAGGGIRDETYYSGFIFAVRGEMGGGFGEKRRRGQETREISAATSKSGVEDRYQGAQGR